MMIEDLSLLKKKTNTNNKPTINNTKTKDSYPISYTLHIISKYYEYMYSLKSINKESFLIDL